jgi:hypothetical protein
MLKSSSLRLYSSNLGTKHNDELYIMEFFMNFELLPILTDYAN